ncbi:hypothetical protein [Pseudanabaena sp. lw0831]|uniref:hypothetical protein n=1 Tax=Pseudanabaena sp. lw0831 TaxID=1357935 RepID=UPI0019162DB5|nr:hypothetical protein [Pseudanabaena sp. lw0831]
MAEATNLGLSVLVEPMHFQCIVVQYPRQDGIDVFRIMSGKQDLISILEDLDYEL